jgi:hypothetical protein
LLLMGALLLPAQAVAVEDPVLVATLEIGLPLVVASDVSQVSGISDWKTWSGSLELYPVAPVGIGYYTARTEGKTEIHCTFYVIPATCGEKNATIDVDAPILLLRASHWRRAEETLALLLFYGRGKASFSYNEPQQPSIRGSGKASLGGVFLDVQQTAPTRHLAARIGVDYLATDTGSANGQALNSRVVRILVGFGVAF